MVYTMTKRERGDWRTCIAVSAGVSSGTIALVGVQSVHALCTVFAWIAVAFVDLCNCKLISSTFYPITHFARQSTHEARVAFTVVLCSETKVYILYSGKYVVPRDVFLSENSIEIND